MTDSFKIPANPAEEAPSKDSNTETEVSKESIAPSTAEAAAIPLRYTEPKWSRLPDEGFSLEVIKSGTLLETITLTSKSFFVFGRLPDCDVTLDHPSISRHHAILQYKGQEELSSDGKTQTSDASPSGFYLYDLGSTHGTKVNKESIRPRTYYRIRLGHVIRFGGSTRMFVLQGEDGTQEGVELEAESEMVEFVRVRVKREEAERKAAEEREAKEAKEAKEGISWGMVDDALDDETAASGKPVVDEDAYYNRDPKKALKHFMDQEGMEIVYDTEEIGKSYDKEFKVTIQLPIQTPSGGLMCGEGMAFKKKDAILLCALDACRILDAQGMLRSSAAERKKKLARNWAKNDYYDSDEDNFLDRTGDVEKKRRKRMQKAGKYKEKTETYGSLSSKLSSVCEEIRKAEEKLALAKKLEKGAPEDEDSLEGFMSNIGGVLDASAKRNIRLKLVELKKEEERLRALANIAKPSDMTKITAKERVSPPKDEGARKKKEWGLVTRPKDVKNVSDGVEVKMKEEKKPEHFASSDSKNRERTRICGPVWQEGNVVDEEEEAKAEAKRRKKKEKRQKFREKMSHQEGGSYAKRFVGWDSDKDPDFAQWLPPDDQSGDGKTSLNEKLGY